MAKEPNSGRWRPLDNCRVPRHEGRLKTPCVGDPYAPDSGGGDGGGDGGIATTAVVRITAGRNPYYGIGYFDENWYLEDAGKVSPKEVFAGQSNVMGIYYADGYLTPSLVFVLDRLPPGASGFARLFVKGVWYDAIRQGSAYVSYYGIYYEDLFSEGDSGVEIRLDLS